MHSQKTITQISTIDALLAGVYDGQMSCQGLRDYGSLGIGTFNHLDGEMIILDGEIYQVKSVDLSKDRSKELKRVEQ